VVGSGAAHHATRDSRAGTASSYCSKGYPYFRVPTTTYISTSCHYYALSTIAYNYVGRHQSSHNSYQDLEEISLTSACL
jgi:hypothetical protein